MLLRLLEFFLLVNWPAWRLLFLFLIWEAQNWISTMRALPEVRKVSGSNALGIGAGSLSGGSGVKLLESQTQLQGSNESSGQA